MGQIDVTVKPYGKKAYPKVVQGSTGVFIKVIETKEGQSFVDAHNNCTTIMFEQAEDGSVTFLLKEGTNVIVANKLISDLLSAFKP